MWVKADMVLTVAYHRLKLLHAGRGADGDRLYDIRNVGEEKLEEIRACIRHALGAWLLFDSSLVAILTSAPEISGI
jgi:hypothetical protein